MRTQPHTLGPTRARRFLLSALSLLALALVSTMNLPRVLARPHFDPHRGGLQSVTAKGAIPTRRDASSSPAQSPDVSGAPSSVAPDADSATEWFRDVPYVRYRLDNGLEVILHRDDAQPLVAVNLWYHVGPVNEPAKRSGFAHLFEHLMFEGSKYVGPHFDHWLEGAGATNSNGTTSWDRTNYFETVPRQYLDLVLWLESDRMGFLRDTITQERLDIQRDVVKNERRQSYENAPYGPSTLVLLDTLFPAGHPYHGAIIGSMADLSAATLQDVREFADKYYAPSNATLCISGNFDPDETRASIAKYFGPLRKIPRPSSVQPRTVRDVLPQASGTRLVVNEPVNVPKVTFGWVTQEAYSGSAAALEVLAHVLSSGRSSRLYKSLVVGKRLAVAADADLDPNALGSLFTIDAMASAGTDVRTLEEALSRELDDIIKRPISAQELRRAKVRIRLELTHDLERLNGPGGESGRAGMLQRFNHYLDNPGGWKAWHETLERVSAKDIEDAVQKYLTAAKRVSVITQPQAATPNTEHSP